MECGFTPPVVLREENGRVALSPTGSSGLKSVSEHQDTWLIACARISVLIDIPDVGCGLG
jgi:hypothetical protein